MDKKYTIVCRNCGEITLSRAEYNRQMARANSGWYCPDCRQAARFGEDDIKQACYHFEEFFACLRPGCGGWANIETDICDVCGAEQQALYYDSLRQEARAALTAANEAAEVGHEWGAYEVDPIVLRIIVPLHEFKPEWYAQWFVGIEDETVYVYRRYPLRPEYARLDD